MNIGIIQRILKIDTEKFEVEVLSGFGCVIEQFHPVFLIEILDREVGQQLEIFFSELEYVFYEIVEGKMVCRVLSLGFRACNYMLCPLSFAASNGFGEQITHDSLLI